MRPALHDVPAVQNDDLVAVSDRGKTVGDHNAGDAPHADGTDYLVLCFGVQRGSRLVQDADRRILGQGSCDLKSLPLSAGEVAAVL